MPAQCGREDAQIRFVTIWELDRAELGLIMSYAADDRDQFRQV